MLSITRGRHSFKMGGEGVLSKVIQDTTLDNYGTFTFNQAVGNNALAAFLIGAIQQFNQDAPITKIDNSWSAGFFLQDDFRVHPRLVLNLGIRYEFQTPFLDPLNRKLTFRPGVQSSVVPTAPRGLLFPGDAGVPRSIINTDYNNFSPRIGLAWDPVRQRQDFRPRQLRRILRQPFGQLLEHFGRQPAVHGAAALRPFG